MFHRKHKSQTWGGGGAPDTTLATKCNVGLLLKISMQLVNVILKKIVEFFVPKIREQIINVATGSFIFEVSP